MSALVCRLSSLGDVVLASSITAHLAPVTFLTSPPYAPLVQDFPGVERVILPGDPFPKADRVLDLQRSLRSRRLLPRAERVDMQRALRWARVAWKVGRPPRRVIDRYAALARVPLSEPPWIPRERQGGWLGVAPGAAHATKRWPGYRDLVARWDGPTLALGGPGEEDLVASVGADRSVCEAGFERTLAALDLCDVLIAGDTGLMHLAAAVGVPVVAIFGPTRSQDGFWCHPGQVVERELACRPCSKHGGAVCPLRDHACLEGLSVERVLSAVAKTLA